MAGEAAYQLSYLMRPLAVWLDDDVVAEDVVPRGEVPSSYAARCRRTMFDHYRAHGFTGSPRVLTDLLGRPPRTFAEHLADRPVPGAAAS